MNYSKSQQEAIRHRDGPMLVLAGPGSGKTAVITARIDSLIREHGVDPSSILVITFTKAAAGEMKQRFLTLCGAERTSVSFGTFHAVFFTVLKHACRYESSNIVTDEQRYRFMREIISGYNLDYREESEFIAGVLAEIGMIKNSRIDLAHFYSSHCGEEVFRSICKAYARRLSDSRLIDFDDMLSLTFDLFQQQPDLLAAWQRKYPYILIDEFQDINRLQYDIVRMMAAPKNNLFIVGDDDQSIYRFRGSKPEIMLGFPKDYPNARTVQLAVNYRCAPDIVAAAGRLIANNVSRFDKELCADRTCRGQLALREFEDQRKQNQWLIEQIRQALREGIPAGEMAVLCRTNTQPRLLLAQMMEQGISFCTRDRIPNLYEHWIAKDIFAYLRIAEGSVARADFLTVMNKPKRYIARDSLCESEVAFDEWIQMYDEQPWIAERIEKLWHDVKELGRMSPYAAVNYIRRGIGYDDYIADYAEYRGVNREDLYEAADEIQESARGYRTTAQWYAHIEKYRARLEQLARRADVRADAVTVSTLHSAKGLEYRLVFMPDANEGIVPYRRAVLAADIEEERRLFYVGMTRAKDALFISYVRSSGDKERYVSRFVEEIAPSRA